MADLFVAGVEDQVGEGRPAGVAPGLELGIELGGALADLGGADSRPQSCSTMAVTLRVETPWTYISARASMSACSLRTPFSKAQG